MSKNLHIATSPLTGTIFCGNVLKDGRTWGANKKDVTIEALVAVAEHALHFGRPVEISKADGTPEFRITVERLLAYNKEFARRGTRSTRNEVLLNEFN